MGSHELITGESQFQVRVQVRTTKTQTKYKTKRLPRKRGVFTQAFALAGMALCMQLTPFTLPDARATVKRIFDVDGTLNRDRAFPGEPGPAWRTWWVFKRVVEVRNMMQPHPENLAEFPFPDVQGKVHLGKELHLPPEIRLYYNEVDRLRTRFARDPQTLNDLRVVELDPDPLDPDKPLLFVPGLYYKESPDTYAFYRFGPNGENYLLEDQRAAEKREELSQGALQWRGSVWNQFVLAMQNPRDVVLSSARYHFDSHWIEWLEHLKEQNEIPAVYSQPKLKKGAPQFFSLMSPDGRKYSRSAAINSLVERKVNIVKRVALDMLRSPRRTPHKENPANLNTLRYTNPVIETDTLIIYEDNPGINQELVRTLENLSSAPHLMHKIKFVLWNTGSAEEVENSLDHKGRRVLVFYNGLFRAATEQEIEFWTTGDQENFCQKLLSAKAQQN